MEFSDVPTQECQPVRNKYIYDYFFSKNLKTGPLLVYTYDDSLICDFSNHPRISN